MQEYITDKKTGRRRGNPPRERERNKRICFKQRNKPNFENCLADLGGGKYDKTNIKKGDAVKIRGDWCKVLSANPTTVRILNSLGWDWMKYPYAEIQEHKSRSET